jgi:hypothetical protein
VLVGLRSLTLVTPGRHGVSSPALVTPGHRPGVNPPALAWDEVGMPLKLLCKVGSRRSHVGPRQRTRVVASCPSHALRIDARRVNPARRLRLAMPNERREWHVWRITDHHVDVIRENRLGMHPHVPRPSRIQYCLRDDRRVGLPKPRDAPPCMPGDVRVKPARLVRSPSPHTKCLSG